MPERRVASVDSSFDSNPAGTGKASAALPRTRAHRRGNREGSIYQRSDGRWVACVTEPSGRRVYRYARTRAAAAAKLAAALKAVQENNPLPPERETVASYLTRWLEGSARLSVRPMTYISYEAIVRRHLVPELGQIRLSRLTPGEVQAMMNRKLAQGLSARRVDYLRSVLRRALNDAMRFGLIGHNVAALVRPPRGPRYEVRPLDPDEVRHLLRAVRDDRLEALYVVAVTLGLRQGEILGLSWADVDLGAGWLQVRHALQRFDHAYHLVEPKSARSRRTLLLPLAARSALERHRRRQEEEQSQAAELWQDHGLVFTTVIGAPLDSTGVTAALQRHLARAGLRRQRFHDLRHACASLLLSRGVSPRVVMEMLGHSQISLTLDTYSHVLPSLLSDAAAQMDDLLRDDDLVPGLAPEAAQPAQSGPEASGGETASYLGQPQIRQQFGGVQPARPGTAPHE